MLAMHGENAGDITRLNMVAATKCYFSSKHVKGLEDIEAIVFSRRYICLLFDRSISVWAKFLVLHGAAYIEDKPTEQYVLQELRLRELYKLARNNGNF